jgi:HAD superfamily hydrolase (TIGR01509 family)
MKTALLFGSIGTIMETSDIQRRAYNQALSEAGLDWEWNRTIYAELLEQSGGKDRLAMLGSATGQPLAQEQIDGIHARKTELACAEIIAAETQPRPGVIDLVRLAKQRGMKLGFVTTTYQPNIDAIFASLGDAVRPQDFDIIIGKDAVANGKPAPDAYHAALAGLGVAAADALAIEDTALSAMAAKRAGIFTVATPGEISGSQDFWQADLIAKSLADAAGELHAEVMAALG